MKKFFSLFFVLIFFFVSFSFAQTEKTVFSFENRLSSFKPFELRGFFVSSNENFLVFNLSNKTNGDFVVLFDVLNNKLFRLDGVSASFLPVIVDNNEYYSLVQQQAGRSRVLLSFAGNKLPIELYSTGDRIVSNVFWSPSGNKLVFVVNNGKTVDLIVLDDVLNAINANGKAKPRAITFSNVPVSSGSQIVFSPNERFLVFVYDSVGLVGKIGYIDLMKQGRFGVLVDDKKQAIAGFSPNWSNDGKKIVHRKPIVSKNGGIEADDLFLLELVFDEKGFIKNYDKKIVGRVSHSDSRLFFSSGDNELFYSAKNEIGYFGLKNNSKNSFLILDSKEMIADFVLQKNDRLFVIKSVLGKGLPELREVFSKQVFLQKKTPMIPTETTAVRKTQEPLANQQEIIPKIVSNISFSNIQEFLLSEDEIEKSFGFKPVAQSLLNPNLSFNPNNSNQISFNLYEGTLMDSTSRFFLYDFLTKKLREINYGEKETKEEEIPNPEDIIQRDVSSKYSLSNLSWKPTVDSKGVQWFAFEAISDAHSQRQIIISNLSNENYFEFFPIYSGTEYISKVEWVGNTIYFTEMGILKGLQIPDEFFLTKNVSLIKTSIVLPDEKMFSFDVSNDEKLIVYDRLYTENELSSNEIVVFDSKSNSKIRLSKKQPHFRQVFPVISADAKTIAFISDDKAFLPEFMQSQNPPISLAAASILFDSTGRPIGFSDYTLVGDFLLAAPNYDIKFSNKFSNIVFYLTQILHGKTGIMHNPDNFYFYNALANQEKIVEFARKYYVTGFGLSHDGKKLVTFSSVMAERKARFLVADVVGN